MWRTYCRDVSSRKVQVTSSRVRDSWRSFSASAGLEPWLTEKHSTSSVPRQMVLRWKARNSLSSNPILAMARRGWFNRERREIWVHKHPEGCKNPPTRQNRGPGRIDQLSNSTCRHRANRKEGKLYHCENENQSVVIVGCWLLLLVVFARLLQATRRIWDTALVKWNREMYEQDSRVRAVRQEDTFQIGFNGTEMHNFLQVLLGSVDEPSQPCIVLFCTAVTPWSAQLPNMGTSQWYPHA